VIKAAICENSVQLKLSFLTAANLLTVIVFLLHAAFILTSFQKDLCVILLQINTL
jgi:hypothetical protein